MKNWVWALPCHLTDTALVCLFQGHLPYFLTAFPGIMSTLLLAASLFIGIITIYRQILKDIIPLNHPQAVIEPLLITLGEGAYEILAFIILYKIGDVMAANMTTLLY